MPLTTGPAWKRAQLYGTPTKRGKIRDVSAKQLIKLYRKGQQSKNRKRKKQQRRNFKTWQRRTRAKLLANRTYWELLLAAWLEEADIDCREQWILGKYFADFLIEPTLVVELDGKQHNEPDQKEHDKERTEYLNSRGFVVLRFPNAAIHQRSKADVLRKIRSHLPT